MASRSIYSPAKVTSRPGFTLTEVLVVLGIFSLVAGLGLFMSMDAYRGYIHREERATIVGILQKARSRSMSNIHQTSWGVCFIAPNYVIFRGSVCAQNISTNEIIPASPSTVTAGLSAPGIVFSQIAGTTSPTSILVSQNGGTTTIDINEEGAVHY